MKNTIKFSTLDERYLTQRRNFSETSGPRELWSVIDHWPLYVGISNLSRFMAISDMLRDTLEVPGHIAEFGSWRGANLMFMAKLLRIYDPHGCKIVHCFESFAGLETFTEQDGDAEFSEGGTYRGNYEELRAMIDLSELGDDIVIHRGDIMQTLPDALKNEGLSFSFIYCDTDLYAPSRLILDSLHPRLSKGGMLVMDEWNYDKWPGEAIAVREFMEAHGQDYEMLHVRNARQPSLALKKLR
jgi:hypothetical protein